MTDVRTRSLSDVTARAFGAAVWLGFGLFNIAAFQDVGIASVWIAAAGCQAIGAVGAWFWPDAPRPVWASILLGLLISYCLLVLGFMFTR